MKGMVISMLNLLRSDLYRLFRSKSLYICTAVAVGFNILGLIISKWAANSSPQLEGLAPISGIDSAMKSLADSNALTIISIFIPIYIIAEFSHGTMKNVVSKGFSKIQIFLSKFITMIIASYLIVLATIIIAAIGATIITGTFGTLNGDYPVELLKVTGIEMLLNIAFVGLIVFISMTIRNLGGTIAINVIGIMQIAPALFMGLQYLVKNKIKFQTYDLFFNMSFFTSNFGSGIGSDYLRAAIVGLIILAVSVAIGLLTFQKSDIK